MTARDLLTIFRRRWLLLVLATLLGVIGVPPATLRRNHRSPSLT